MKSSPLALTALVLLGLDTRSGPPANPDPTSAGPRWPQPMSPTAPRQCLPMQTTTPAFAFPPPTQTFATLATMDARYSGEAERGVVRYLSDEERDAFRVDIRDGKLHDAQGRPLDAVGACAVMDESGQLFAGEICHEPEFHHSSFLGGQPVAYAGDIYARHGGLNYIDRRSGHYRTTGQQLDQAVQHLASQGVEVVSVWHGVD